MKKILCWLLVALFCVFAAACGSAPADDPAPEQEPVTADPAQPEPETQPTDLPPIAEQTPEQLQTSLGPYLAAYDAVVQDSFGVECAPETYMLLYSSEEAAMTAPGQPAALIAAGEPVPEGLVVDPTAAALYAVSNYTDMAALTSQLDQFMAPEVYEGNLALNFLEYEGQLYLVRGGRGYGAMHLDLASVQFGAATADGFTVTLDGYLFDEKEATATLTFRGEGATLLLIAADWPALN